MNYGKPMQSKIFHTKTVRYNNYHSSEVIKTVFIIVFRGAGQEVGRSCIMLEFKGKKIMVGVFCFHIPKI